MDFKEPRYDAFLSYSSADAAFARSLFERLRQDGASCFFAEESIPWGENIPPSIEEALDASRHVVILLSSNYVKSGWALIERSSPMMDDPANLERRLLPLFVRDCEIPRFLKPIKYLDCRTRKKFEEAYPKILATLRPPPGPVPVTLVRGVVPPVPDRLPERFDVPFRSLGDRFVGRAGLLWEIHDSLFPGRVVAVTGASPHGFTSLEGLAGVGKSQIAVEYAHRFSPLYSGGVYWVRAESTPRLAAARRIARAADFKLPRGDPEDLSIRLLWNRLAALGPSLVVLDNFPEDQALEPWLPPSGAIHMLVTTRRRRAGFSARMIDVGVLSPDEAVRLITRGNPPPTEEEQRAAAELAARLGFLPVALEIAAAFVEESPGLGFAGLALAIERRNATEAVAAMGQKYRGTLPGGREPDILALFDESWRACSPAARTVLGSMSFLAPERVPLDLLRESLAGAMRARDAIDDPVSAAVGDLAGRSLVACDAAGNPLAHRLVLEFARHVAPSQEGARRAAEAAILKSMNSIFDPGGRETTEPLKSIVPHAEALASRAKEERRWTDLDDLATAIHRYHVETGLAAAAERWSREALGAVQVIEGGVPGPKTARALSNLALVLKDLARPADARPLLEQALATAEKALGPEHPSVGIDLNNLAMVLLDLACPAEALPLLKRALSIDEKALGREHPKVAVDLANLAMTLTALGCPADALPPLERALAIDQKALGPEHPKVAVDLGNRAMVLKDLGRPADALPLVERALDIHKKALGAEHPKVGVDLGNRAMVLKDLGRPADALPLLQQALGIHKKALGAEHPTVAIDLNNMATVLAELSRAREALPLAERAVALLEASLGPDHPDVRMARKNLEAIRQAAEKV
ncbi:MAG: toll/interleukin-1 receptor domain-containing protein [Planctomycetes bacterium]|nr:toll/interleukin-1 receptor domain-containing protein [Planctomycetota bacterium]